MSNEIIMWYEDGESLPWRFLVRDEFDNRWGEVHADTFAEILLLLGAAWAREMPEPKPEPVGYASSDNTVL